MLTKIYILISPIIAWGLLFLVAFIGFCAASSVSSWFIYICVGLIFIMPIVACILLWYRLRTLGFWQNTLYILAVVPNVLLFLLLVGELISGIHPILHFVGYATFKTCKTIGLLWLLTIVIYALHYYFTCLKKK